MSGAKPQATRRNGGDQEHNSPTHTLPPVKKGERIVLRIGAVLVGLGLLFLAFVAYQLWAPRSTNHMRRVTCAANCRHNCIVRCRIRSQQIPQSTKLPALASEPAPLTPDPPDSAPVGFLSIPKIGLNDAIVEGVDEADLEQGPGHYPGTPLPGEPGNVAIAGHRTTYAHPFYNLDQLAVGDPIFIMTTQGLFRYNVSGTQIVPPTDVAVLDTTSSAATLTLTTCNPRYSAATRMVVTADFVPGPKGGQDWRNELGLAHQEHNLAVTVCDEHCRRFLDR